MTSMEELAKRWELNNNAPAKKKNAMAQRAGAAVLGSAAGGAVYGNKASELALNRNYSMASRGMARDLGHGFKSAAKTKTGAAALAVGAASVGAAHLNAHKGKKEGTIIRVKKSSTVSAFGVEHGNIAKFSLPGVGAKVAGATAKLGNKASSAGMGNRIGAAAKRPGSFAGRSQNAAGSAQGKLGGQLKKLGGAMAAKPGLTGGAAVGGAAAGGGMFAGAVANRRRF